MTIPIDECTIVCVQTDKFNSSSVPDKRSPAVIHRKLHLLKYAGSTATPAARMLTIVLLILVCQSCAHHSPFSQPPAKFQEFSLQHRDAIVQLSDYLARSQVNNVVPLHELLQQGTDWSAHRQPRYAVPPKYLWPNMVRTLKLIDRFIIPAIGPIKVVSGFRTPQYNRLAGGANRSKHMEFSALDVISRLNPTRSNLHERLLRVWNVHGRQLDMGLGLYGGGRFHIDTSGYRKWQG